MGFSRQEYWSWGAIAFSSCVQFFATSWIVRLPWQQDSPGNNATVGCYALLQGIFLIQRLNLRLLHCQASSLPLTPRGNPTQNKTCVLCLVTQSCPALYDHMDCSLPGSSVHGDSPGKNSRADCRARLSSISSHLIYPVNFPTSVFVH